MAADARLSWSRLAATSTDPNQAHVEQSGAVSPRPSSVFTARSTRLSPPSRSSALEPPRVMDLIRSDRPAASTTPTRGSNAGHLARRRVDPGRDVDRHDISVRCVDALDELRRLGLRGSAEPRPEEGIDDDVVPVQVLLRLVRDDARLAQDARGYPPVRRSILRRTHADEACCRNARIASRATAAPRAPSAPGIESG
jgi:hypothetical protein